MPGAERSPSEPINDEDQDDAHVAAQQWVHQLRVFYTHAGVAAASLTIIFAVNLVTNLEAGLTSDWSTWWSLWALIGWTAGLAVHGLVVRLNRPKPAISSWEQQQIDRVLSR
jgi:hypothetical protein